MPGLLSRTVLRVIVESSERLERMMMMVAVGRIACTKSVICYRSHGIVLTAMYIAAFPKIVVARPKGVWVSVYTSPRTLLTSYVTV